MQQTNRHRRSSRGAGGLIEEGDASAKRKRGRPRKAALGDGGGDGGAAASSSAGSSGELAAGVAATYGVIRRATGATGGGANGGAIYGEIGATSFQRVVDYLKGSCGLDAQSYFLDVGSGLGKPNLHVAQDPGVACSVGVEADETRWQLGLHNLNSVFRACAEDATLVSPKVAFARRDVDDCETLDPFSHVYAFDVGFPPALLLSLGRKFNASKATCAYYVSYQNPRRFLGDYGFRAELATQLTVSMHGSSESHTCYVYRRVVSAESSALEGAGAGEDLPRSARGARKRPRASFGSGGGDHGGADGALAEAVAAARKGDAARAAACSAALEAALESRPTRDRSPREEWRPEAEGEFKGCGYDMSTVAKCGRGDRDFAAGTEQGRERVRKSQLQRLVSRSISTRFG